MKALGVVLSSGEGESGAGGCRTLGAGVGDLVVGVGSVDAMQDSKRSE